MDIRTYLGSGHPLIFDGAMGTCFSSLPGRAEERCERANLDHPEDILSIHRAYLEAGALAIKTNTFSAGADAVGGDTEFARQVIRAGCRLAREAAEPYGAYVFADIGPASGSPAGGPGDLYCWQADQFLELGIRHFLVETLPSAEGVPELARHLKARCPEAFLIVSYAVQPDGITREGQSGRELFARTAALPEVDAVGFNCVSGPHHMLEYIRGLDLGDTLLSAMPNAGYPTVLGRRAVYQGQPDYFAQKMAQIAGAGARIVGGCCGTTPEHIARMVRALSAPPAEEGSPAAKAGPRRAAVPESPFWEKLKAGQRVVAVELDPPADGDPAPFLSGARLLRDSGADIITIADCPVGRPRADSSLLSCKLRRELGVEPLPHLTCRDRNLNATKALLLGLSMEGVRNVLLVTGDPIPSAERDEVKSVFNFNSRKLARYVAELNETTLPVPFHMFGALNLNARNFQIQLRLAAEKEENGMEGFLTQPVLSAQALENLKLARSVLKGKILGGIFPVVSHRNACFLNNEVSGIHVCDEIVALYAGRNRQQGEDLAMDISCRVAAEMAPYTDGFYLMTPFRRVELTAAILERIKTIPV